MVKMEVISPNLIMHLIIHMWWEWMVDDGHNCCGNGWLGYRLIFSAPPIRPIRQQALGLFVLLFPLIFGGIFVFVLLSTAKTLAVLNRIV